VYSDREDPRDRYHDFLRRFPGIPEVAAGKRWILPQLNPGSVNTLFSDGVSHPFAYKGLRKENRDGVEATH